jgi:hypothetical protein
MYTSLFIIAFAGLLHASFQLGVSMLTMLSGHSLGMGRSFQRLMRLNVAYFCGAAVITLLLFTGLAYLISHSQIEMTSLWLGTSLFNIIIGLLVMLFYFNRSRKSTGLWIPRAMAEYLRVRTKKTKRAAEAFTLGAGSVLAEAPFLIAPLMVAILYSLTSVPSTSFNRLAELGIYSLVSLLPLIVIIAMVGAGHKISTIQRWREDNKLFLQYCAGAGLVILGAFVYVDKVMAGVGQ